MEGVVGLSAGSVLKGAGRVFSTHSFSVEWWLAGNM
jgi:hypothetical protein